MESYRKFIFAYIAWWLACTTVHAAVVWHFGFSIELSIADALISNVVLSLISLALINILRYYRPGVSTSWNLLLWCGLSAGMFVIIVYWGVKYFYSADAEYLSFFYISTPVRYWVSFLLVGCMVLLSWMRKTLISQKEEATHKADIEKISKETELNSLRQQMQPHFLFNSLNSISALIGSNPGDARKMVQNLSEFMRYTLKKDSEKFTTLQEEINHLELYLEIEKQRFGHRLQTQIKTDEATLMLNVPFLLLQPIVENAIKFGLYGTTEACSISIEASKQENELQIIITNPFDKESQQTNKGTGFGLSSIQRRLYLLFGRNDLLQINAEENTFVTTIKIPQQID